MELRVLRSGVATGLVLAVGGLGCSSPASPALATTCGDGSIVVAASDYQSSAVGSFTLGGVGTISPPAVDLGKDPSLSATGGAMFFVARDFETVFELDACGKPFRKFAVGDPAGTGLVTNPHDLALAKDQRLFVTRFDVPSLLVLDASRLPAQTIDLSSFDADGNPNADAIRIATVGGSEKAFVTLERLDDTDPLLRSKQPSWMLRIDVATSTVEAHVELAGRNPFSTFEQGATLYLAEPGNFDLLDEPLAGIEAFDYATSTSHLLVHEQDLGGSVAEVAISPEAADGALCGVAIVADATPGVNRTSLVTFDARSGTVLTDAAHAVLGTDGFDLEGLTWRGQTLLVGDRRAAPGGFPVHAFDRADGCAVVERKEPVVYLPQKPVAFRVSR